MKVDCVEAAIKNFLLFSAKTVFSKNVSEVWLEIVDVQTLSFSFMPSSSRGTIGLHVIHKRALRKNVRFRKPTALKRKT